MELFSHTPLDHAPNHGLRIHNDYIPNSLQPKAISETQKENSVKCMKISAFCRKNGFVMELFSHTPLDQITDYGHMMTRSQIPYSPPKITSQTQIENCAKCMEILAFCRKKIDSVLCKITDQGYTVTKFEQVVCTQYIVLALVCTTKNTLKHFKTYWADLPN